MKAVVFYSPARVELAERELPTRTSDDEALVRVIACGLCGSDLRLMTDPPQMPCVPNAVIGHEIVGVIEETANGSELVVGDAVVVVPNIRCGTCPQCMRGAMNLCENFKHIGTHLPGGLAENLWVPATALHRVPDGLDPYIAALAEPLACILNGTTRVRWHAGEPIAILGAGPIGLLFLAVAKLSGAGPIVVSDPNPSRRELAVALGADAVVDPTDPGASEQWLTHLGEYGAKTVIDALGTLLPTALEVVARGGEIVLFGVNHQAEVTIHPTEIVDKDLTIYGTYIHRGTFALALRLLAQHPDLFSQIITHRLRLDEWEVARKLLISGQAPGKILITIGLR
jgi:threonine dehydrogenase-like Zn-dependent dehydrogenase